jgi:hypothetical protein
MVINSVSEPHHYDASTAGMWIRISIGSELNIFVDTNSEEKKENNHFLLFFLIDRKEIEQNASIFDFETPCGCGSNTHTK